jgi:trimeric autotransporter adhesin
MRGYKFIIVALLLLMVLAETSPAQLYVINTVAGGGPNDVPALKASIGPAGVGSDPAGNIYIASPSVIFKVDTAGNLTIVAGNGFAGYSGDGGPATQAELNGPQGVSIDGSGNIFIADTDNNRIREVVAATGIIQTVAGNGKAGYSGDGGKATQAELNGPSTVSVDRSGSIVITDADNYRIREVVAATGAIQTVAGNGTRGYSGDGGKATQAELDFPNAACVDDSGNIFISEPVNPRIREVVAATGIIQTVAGNGMSGDSGDGGPATQAELADPRGVSVDNSGNLFIADWDSGRIREVVTAAGTIQTVAGNGKAGYSGDGGPATQAELDGPQGVSIDGSGNIFIADTVNSVVREVVAAGGIIKTVAGNGRLNYSGDGSPATQAELNGPQGAFIDGSGNIFIADSGDDVIREVVAKTGIIQTVAGNGKTGFTGDGGPATQAELDDPDGVSVDNSGNIFIADSGNEVIREVVAKTGMIQTVAGDGGVGYSGDGGKATQAELGFPGGVFVDGSGNLFIADSYFYFCYIDPDGSLLCLPTSGGTIRKVDAATGNIQTLAGNGTEGYSGDGGPATQAELNNPSGVFVDASGDIFIADTWNMRIREVVAATGVIETVAGNGTEGYSGDGGPATQAELSIPSAVSVDGSGNIFIADSGNMRIREVVAATGVIQTLAGNGKAGYSGDGGPATQAELASPSGLVLDSAGNIVFADPLSGRIRELVPTDFEVTAEPSSITVTAGQSGQTTLTVTPVNGFNQSVSFSCTGLPALASCSATSVMPNGSDVQSILTITTSTGSANLRPNPTGSSRGPSYAILLSWLTGLGGLVSFGTWSLRRLRVSRLFPALIALCLWMPACGGTGGGGGKPVVSTVNVTASSGSLHHATTITLTVQ